MYVRLLYLYSVQYLHVLQDSKHYMTHLTVQEQSNSEITNIPLTEAQRLKDDNSSTFLRFFNLPLGIGPNDRGHLSCYVSACTWDWTHVL